MEPETASELPPTPPVEAPAPTQAPAKKMWATLLAAILIPALIAGGAVYAYQKKQQTTATHDLQAQIDSLKTQLAATPTPTATPTATPAASASPTSTADCLSSFTLSLVENGGGTAGTYYYNIALTNAGSQSCTISGFPAASLLSSDGTVLGKATNSTTVTTQSLVVAPGKVVYAALGFPNAGNFDPGTCSAAAATLSVTPPGASKALTTPVTRPYCPGFSVSALSATAL